ncbi:MAG: MarR family transcriptional regulator [Gemmatimonadaceae bacterium]|nr:MarR family transcriptional regulator [Gemmatimonadaceae bacterium]
MTTHPLRHTRDPAHEHRIAQVRQFNRFYTRHIGVLQRGHLDTEFSLGEVRVLYELAHRGTATAAELAADLDLDAGYLSRMLQSFGRKRLVARRRHPNDGRRRVLSLTAAGRATFSTLDRGAMDNVAQLIDHLEPDQRATLVAAMQTIEQLLRPDTQSPPVLPSAGSSSVLRQPEPGDLGWVLHRHGALYAREYGWDWRFEGLVAGVLSTFVANYTPSRERCWIAERDDAIVGSVFIVQESAAVARLRLLYVEPSARGAGVGRALVRECIRFARRVGYQRITLWTNSVLVAARRIYEAEGFELKETGLHDHFGVELTGETWELVL